MRLIRATQDSVTVRLAEQQDLTSATTEWRMACDRASVLTNRNATSPFRVNPTGRGDLHWLQHADSVVHRLADCNCVRGRHFVYCREPRSLLPDEVSKRFLGAAEQARRK